MRGGAADGLDTQGPIGSKTTDRSKATVAREGGVQLNEQWMPSLKIGQGSHCSGPSCNGTTIEGWIGAPAYHDFHQASFPMDPGSLML